MKFPRKFLLVEVLIVLAIIALLAALLSPRVSQAQPYITNTAPYGAATYNSSYPTPLQPSKTLAAQYASGMLAGSIAPGTIPLGGAGYTLTFSTNIYSAPPFVLLCTSTTNSVAAVLSVTTTNCVIQVQPTNGVTVYWEATGH